MSYNAQLQENNADLQEILDAVNALPDAGGDEYKLILIGLMNGTITNFEIPVGATKIRDSFFKDFTALQSVVIPDSVGTIGTQAFKNCTALQSVVIPGSVASIDSGYSGPANGQFSGCTALESVVIEDGVQTLAGALFYNCSSLKVVKFRGVVSFVKRTGYYPFLGCTALTDIYVPWAEGEVDGAPWDATNATIHYNTPVD